jgi:pyruvate dehydrogenase phosphatase
VCRLTAVSLASWRRFDVNPALIVGAQLTERALGIGDVPFKLPPIFTRKVLYNLHPGFHASSPWEHFLVRNRTPPYISADAEVVHQRLGHEKHFLVLCTDGFADLSNSEDSAHAAGDWSRILSRIASQSVAKTNTNLAAELLHQVLGGDNVDGVSRAITLELEEPWFDDATVIVLSM